MAPGLGVKLPDRRTKTGCLTCRKRKVKCDEEKPSCYRCRRLRIECIWPGQDTPNSSNSKSLSKITSDNPFDAVIKRQCTIKNLSSTSQTFIMEFPNASRSSVPYLHHFITFCSRFLAYANDAEGNPFQQDLVPLAVGSKALFHSMAALAAGHMSRVGGQPKHTMAAVQHYSVALRELNTALSDPAQVRTNTVLGTCLLLCVYEISHSDESVWFQHLQGARDLIIMRGGPKVSDFLVRFFSLLDISGSLLTGAGPLIPGNYWLEDENPSGEENNGKLKWPYYDDGAVMVDSFHSLMVYMAKLSNLSRESMSDFGRLNPEYIADKAITIRTELEQWWQSSSPCLRDQEYNWRNIPRAQELTLAERMEQEAFASTRSVVHGCVIYLNHIIDPTAKEMNEEVKQCVEGVFAIAKETPEGFGLEMGLLFGLFMAGVVIFNDPTSETLIRRKLGSDSSISIYHADRGLELLEVLWSKQNQTQQKYDWREVQKEMNIQVFILC